LRRPTRWDIQSEKFRYRKFTIERISSSGIHFRPTLPPDIGAAGVHGYPYTRVWHTFLTRTNHHHHSTTPTTTTSNTTLIFHPIFHRSQYNNIIGVEVWKAAHSFCYLFGSINLCHFSLPHPSRNHVSIHYNIGNFPQRAVRKKSHRFSFICQTAKPNRYPWCQPARER